MNSLIQDSEHPFNEGLNQLKDSRKSFMKKSYSFFVYYKIGQQNENLKLQSLTRLSFRLKQQKQSIPSDKYLQPCNSKSINLFFTNLQIQNQLQNSFIQLKFHMIQNKTKIIFIGRQKNLFYLIDKSQQFGIDLRTVPIALYSTQHKNDLSIFLGWNILDLRNFADKTPEMLAPFARQWIQSPAQKIDLWQVSLKVKQAGSIKKLVPNQNNLLSFTTLDKKQIKEYFLSSFTVGYHSKMFVDYQISKKHQQNIINMLKLNMHGLKNFCCVGSPSLQASTGIVTINYIDQNSIQTQLIAHFLPQPSQQNKSHRKVLSLVLSNIDLYHGLKLPSTKINDNKIQMFSFRAQNQFQKIAQLGDVKMGFQTQNDVYICIADQCYILNQPIQVTIKPFKKLKVLVNKESLGC